MSISVAGNSHTVSHRLISLSVNVRNCRLFIILTFSPLLICLITKHGCLPFVLGYLIENAELSFTLRQSGFLYLPIFCISILSKTKA